MEDVIQAGSILIEDGVRVPEFLRSETPPFSNGWRLVRRLDGQDLRRRIRAAGRTFRPVGGPSPPSPLYEDERTTRRNEVANVPEDGKTPS